MTTLSVTDARKKLTTLVKKADENLEEFVITREGKPRAVLMSAEEFESWKETIEILSDKKLMKKIAEGEKAIKKGDVVRLEDI